MIIHRTIGLIKKNPFILLFPGIMFLVYSIVSIYNPLYAVFLSLIRSVGENSFEGIIVTIKYMCEPRIIILGLVLLSGILLAVSCLVSLLFSGYFFVVDNLLKNKATYKAEFFNGIQKYFFKILFITFISGVFGCFLLFFMFIASVPSIIITKSWIAGENQLLTAVIFVNILTVAVLFLVFMFYRIYILFWYPAVYNEKKKFFLKGKHVADSCFWNILVKFLGFDAVFIIFVIINSYLKYLVYEHDHVSQYLLLCIFFAGWVFRTLFFTFVVFFIFDIYNNRNHFAK